MAYINGEEILFSPIVNITEGTNGGYQEGYEAGENVGFNNGYKSGYDDGHTAGYDSGYDMGYQNGRGETDVGSYESGYNQGYIDGEAVGYTNGYSSGETDGYNEGYNEGCNEGYSDGYENGFEAGKNEGGGSDEPLIIDTSVMGNLRNIFKGSNIKRIKTFDARSATLGWNGMAHMFYRSQIEEIQEFYPSTQTVFYGAFLECYKLKRVIFKSEIAVEDLNLANSKLLDKESIYSIIENLSDTTSGITVTLSRDAVNREFEDEPEVNNGSGVEEWLALVSLKPNWTISLA